MAITKKETIDERILSDYEYLESMGYEVVGVFLYGSQNYGLDYEGSDIDTKAIILPTFKDFILNKKPVSTTLTLSSNEHIDVKDIRLMFECFRKQNINFIEILFTEYRVLNPEYEMLVQPLFQNSEKIARYNNYKSINCMAGMVYEKYKALEHPYPTIKNKIEKYGYDPKQLHHIVRLYEFMNRYIKGEPYADCLKSRRPEYLIKIKKGFYSLEEAREMADVTNDAIKDIKDTYMSSTPLKVDKQVESLLNEVLVDVIGYGFTKLLQNKG